MTGARHLIGRLAATLRPPVSAAAAGGCVSYGAASSLDRSWLLDPSSAQQRPGGGGQPQLLWGAGEHRRQGGKRPLLPAVRALQLVQVVAEMGLARELGEPHEDVLACAYRQGGRKFTANCGYSRGYSVLEVVESVKRVSGCDFRVVLDARRP